MKGVIIYHKMDLDGLASGAILKSHLEFNQFELLGYHYGEPIDLRKFKGKMVVMADVSLEPEKMFSLAKIASQLIFIDHHVSAYEKMIQYAEENNFNPLVGEFNGLIKDIVFDGVNMRYFYSDRLSACEVCRTIYPMGNELTMAKIRLLGQYDTWRNTEERKFINDSKWEKALRFQYGMRNIGTVEELINEFYSSNTIEYIETIGEAIIKYQEALDVKSMNNNSFEFDFCGIRVLACNGVVANSGSFKSAYHEDVHDAMMPFNFDGKNNVWNFSLYTTKDDVDILSIAKSFGGGGHAKACGFQLKPKDIFIDSKGIQSQLFSIDVASIPEGVNLDDVNKMLEEIKKVPLTFVPTKQE